MRLAENNIMIIKLHFLMISHISEEVNLLIIDITSGLLHSKNSRALPLEDDPEKQIKYGV